MNRGYGEELKGYAGRIMRAGIIMGIVALIGIISVLSELGFTAIIVGIVVALIVIGNAYFQYLLLGGFGALIDETCNIHHKLSVSNSNEHEKKDYEKIPTWKKNQNSNN